MSETANKKFTGLDANVSEGKPGRRISSFVRSPLDKEDAIISPFEVDQSEDAKRLRTFSFPCVNAGDYQHQLVDRRRSTNTGEIHDPESLMNMEKTFHMEESQSEALFNRLKTYAIGESKESDSKYSKLKSKFWSHSRKSSQDSPRLSLISSQRRSSVFSTNAPSDSSGSSRPSISSVGSANRKTFHRRSRESVSIPIQIHPLIAKGSEDSGSPGLSISIQDPEQGCEKQFTVTRAELDEISKNTEEQIRRNSTGNYSSLIEFASKTGTQTKGHVFAHCAENDKSDAPIIVLDAGLWDLESSNSSNDVADRKSMDSTVSSVGLLNGSLDFSNPSKFGHITTVLDEEDECEDDAPVAKDKHFEVLANNDQF